MIKRLCCALFLAGAALPPIPAVALDGYRCCDWLGGVWGGRRAWDGGYGWHGSGYYVPLTGGRAGMAAPVGGGGTASGSGPAE
jgi:hypothetical protein